MVIRLRIHLLQLLQRFGIPEEGMERDAVRNALKIPAGFLFKDFPEGLQRLFILSLRQLGPPEQGQGLHVLRILFQDPKADLLYLLVISLVLTLKRLTHGLADLRRKLSGILVHLPQKNVGFRPYGQLLACCRHMINPPDEKNVCIK